jgi:Fe-S cluster assembly protein SufD
MVFDVDASASLPGPEWLKSARQAAASFLRGRPLPTAEEELWRYSRIDDVDLTAYDLQSSSPSVPALPQESQDLVPVDVSVAIKTVNGRITAVVVAESSPVRVRTASGDESLHAAGNLVTEDYFERLNAALAPDVIVVDVPAGKFVEQPIVITHVIDDNVMAFPRLVVNAGEQSQFTVAEYAMSAGSGDALLVSFTELNVAAAANVGYTNVQLLNDKSKAIAYQASTVERDATFSSSTVALGGSYARVRTDSRLIGKGGTSRLDAVYFGAENQMHDFRTIQDHRAPKTTSDLLFKGVVSGRSHSVYSGLIRVEKGAAGTNAFQTNRNLVLDEGARADSVPNLEIEENDVRCSHASAVGPVDEEQLYYLESRGVPTEAAERLIVTGFLHEMLSRLPVPAVREPLTAEVTRRLARVLKQS